VIGLNKPTSRQAQLLSSKNKEIFRSEKEKYSRMSAVSSLKNKAILEKREDSKLAKKALK